MYVINKLASNVYLLLSILFSTAVGIHLKQCIGLKPYKLYSYSSVGQKFSMVSPNSNPDIGSLCYFQGALREKLLSAHLTH